MTAAARTVTVSAGGGGHRIIRKAPGDVIDVAFDWSAALDSGDTITGTPTWTVGAGLTKDSQSNTTTSATAFLSGGTADASYLVLCKVVTTGGRTIERGCTVQVRSPVL